VTLGTFVTFALRGTPLASASQPWSPCGSNSRIN